jgi:hypothetical protein
MPVAKDEQHPAAVVVSDVISDYNSSEEGRSHHVDDHQRNELRIEVGDVSDKPEEQDLLDDPQTIGGQRQGELEPAAEKNLQANKKELEGAEPARNSLAPIGLGYGWEDINLEGIPSDVVRIRHPRAGL